MNFCNFSFANLIGFTKFVKTTLPVKFVQYIDPPNLYVCMLSLVAMAALHCARRMGV